MNNNNLQNGIKDFLEGARAGISIALGYLAVSFSFGMTAVSSGIPAWAAIVISMTNLTSAGQFAGMTLITQTAPYMEMAAAMVIINIRYMLMSLALSQKLEKMNLFKRLAVAFGITDEIFAVAMTRCRRLTYMYMLGLIFTPYIGWSAGTALGAVAGGLLSPRLASCLGITLYAMFIAICVPEMRKSRAVCTAVVIAAVISSLLKNMSAGWSVIISAAVASCAAAILFPIKEEENE